MNLVSRMRNAGAVVKNCTTSEPIPMIKQRQRYHYRQFTNNSARIPLQSRFYGSPNIRGNRWYIQANRKLDSFSPGEAIPEISLHCLY